MEAFSRPITDARSVSELVELARLGRLRIPPFQRRFRWYGNDIERLFDSVRRGYPIGSFLLWERAAEAGHVDFGPLRVEAPELQDAWWVVDGQQRLTSLVGVLASPPGGGVEFDLYYDLSAEAFRRPGSRRPRQDWIPLRKVIDTNDFLSWLLAFREEGASGEQVQAATELGNRLRDYKIPIWVVRDATEQELRDIFDRMNTFGRRLTQAEVFQALHAATSDAEPADLRGLVEEVRDIGFGSLQQDTVLRALLAARGGDPYRDFHGEFEGEDPAEAFAATAAALRRTVDFLQREAGVPHLRVLPYVYVVPVLTRFFALHGEASARNRILLRRWLWRDAVAGGSGGSGAASVLQRAARAIDEDEDASVQRLLALVPTGEQAHLDLASHQLNRAAGRINVALLDRLHPLDLRDGKEVDVAALLEEGELLRVALKAGRVDSVAGVFLHAPLRDDEIAEAFAGAPDEVLASHGLDRKGVVAADGDLGKLVASRANTLAGVLLVRLRTLIEPAASDRPAITSLTVPDGERP
jgi:hypothetical protein